MAGGPAPSRRRDRAQTTEYAAIVFDLRLEGLSYAAIDALTQNPDGPTGGHRLSATIAKDLVKEEAARRLDPRVEAWRAIESARLEAGMARLRESDEQLDKLSAATWDVLEREHITVNNGRIIALEGVPLPDYGPVLQAIGRLTNIENTRRGNVEARRRLGESLRKLHGLDAPVRTEVTVTEVTQQDIKLQEMVAEYKAKNANIEADLRTAREHPE